MKKIILTGDRPTGKLHLGHYIGSLVNRVKLQDPCDQYVMLADLQALTDNVASVKQLSADVYNIAMDYLSVVIDPNKTTILIQSQIPELTELAFYYLNLVTISRLERNPTVKSEIQQKKFDNSIPAGFFCYPVSQAADITGFKADLVPAGEDQAPMIEQTNEIVRKFNSTYQTNCLKEVKIVLSDTSRLVGIDGKSKASKSLNNAIYLSDPPDEIKRKIFEMYTDPNHIRISDPGQVEGNVVFAYLDAFYSDKEALEDLKNHYRRGGLGDVTIKNLLNDTLQTFLAPIREIRNKIKREEIKEILYLGSNKARKVVQNTVLEVREAMGINYF